MVPDPYIFLHINYGNNSVRSLNQLPTVMKNFLRLCLSLVFTIVILLVFAFFLWYKPRLKPARHEAYRAELIRSSPELNRLQEKAGLLRQFALAHRFNTSVCFLVDMKIASGKNRFFVYDMEKD